MYAIRDVVVVHGLVGIIVNWAGPPLWRTYQVRFTDQTWLWCDEDQMEPAGAPVRARNHS